MGFVKLHDAILKSSILEEDIIVRWVWICLLVSCDRNGNIYGTRMALARRANVPLEEFERALAVLTSPDPNSTSPDEEGRRVLELESNLLHCVNYQHYRGLRDPEEVREQVRERVRRHRAKKKAEQEASNADVTKSNDIAEAEAEAEADIKKTTSSSSSRKDDDDLVKFVLDFWKEEDLRPSLRAISKERRAALLARKREHGESNVMLVLNNRANSRFLCYEINHNRGAGFDWVFGPKNFVKVMDGNYNDELGGSRGKGKSEYDEAAL